MSDNSPQYQASAPQHPGLIRVPAAVAVTPAGAIIPVSSSKSTRVGQITQDNLKSQGVVATHGIRIFIPMIFRLAIPNSPFAAAPLILYVSPAEIQVSRKKALTEHVIRGGTIREEWGDELDVWSCSGQIAAFYTQDFGLTQVRRSETASYKNFLGLLGFYKNNGRAYYSRGRSSDPFTREDQERLFSNAQESDRSYRNFLDKSRRKPSLVATYKRTATYDRISSTFGVGESSRTEQRRKGLTNAPSRIIRHVGFVEILYDMRILEGHFDSFEWEDNVSHPHNINYNFSFTVKRQFDMAARISGYGTTRA